MVARLTSSDAPMALGTIRALASTTRTILDEPRPVIARCSSSWCRMRLMLEHEAARGTCDECASGGLRAVQSNAMRERIPIKFRWARLNAPMIPPNKSEEVATEILRKDALSWLASDVQTLMIAGRPLPDGTAPTGVGKSSFAGGVADAAIEARWPIIWIRAAELGPMYPDRHRPILDSLESAGRTIVFVDGLGKELALAKVDSGVITQRVPAMQELIALVYECPKIRFVFTSDITGQMLNDAYGADAVRRIAKKPNATIIML